MENVSSQPVALSPLAAVEYQTLEIAAVAFIVAFIISLFFWFTRSKALGIVSYGVSVLATVVLTATLVIRQINVGHPPFVQLYETYLFIGWAIAAISVISDPLLKSRLPSSVANLVTGLILFYIWTWDESNRVGHNLLPALQSPWLYVHIATTLLSYAGFAISAGAAIVYLFKRNDKVDELSYKLVSFSFPLLLLGILLGAVWAKEVYMKYWQWDPKETAALVSWLIYAAYLHARLVLGWKGTKASVLNLIGFAAVIFTWIGLNIVSRLIDLGGYHNY